jgi:hypothetical protein
VGEERHRADWFFAETGILAPGKDWPAAMGEPHEDRNELWAKFLRERGI